MLERDTRTEELGAECLPLRTATPSLRFSKRGGQSKMWTPDDGPQKAWVEDTPREQVAAFLRGDPGNQARQRISCLPKRENPTDSCTVGLPVGYRLR